MFFRNKSLQVKMVEDQPEPCMPPLDHDKIVTSITASVLVCMGAYFAGDTLRKCIIHTVATKVQ